MFSIAIVDADEFDVTAPTDSNAAANAVNENVAIGTTVGITASASDADATTNTVTYSLFDSDGGNFAIDANTGIVTTAAALNRETLRRFAEHYCASHFGGRFDSGYGLHH